MMATLKTGFMICRGLLALGIFFGAMILAKRLEAAEGAAGFYLLGSKTSMGGFVPPPGTYVQDLNYFYTGNADVALSLGGISVTGGIDADAYYKLPTLLWVSDRKVLGGNVAFTAIAPIGWKDVSAGAQITGPGGGIVDGQLQDDGTRFGDPVVGGLIGWHQGNWHWNVTTLVNIPIGYWEVGDL
ncbi:MAG: transporter, partial [Alphaproteobacteria bacterium]|nr:transporter [Alphaproteobacteria bacterium]